jgi:hypothetical protein
MRLLFHNTLFWDDNVEEKITIFLDSNNKDYKEWNKSIMKETDNIVLDTEQVLTINGKEDKEDSSSGESKCDH